MPSHVGAVAAATAAAVIAEVPPISGAERFMVVATVLLVGDTQLRDAAMDTAAR
jgi:hypothetical protein